MSSDWCSVKWCRLLMFWDLISSLPAKMNFCWQIKLLLSIERNSGMQTLWFSKNHDGSTLNQIYHPLSVHNISFVILFLLLDIYWCCISVRQNRIYKKITFILVFSLLLENKLSFTWGCSGISPLFYWIIRNIQDTQWKLFLLKLTCHRLSN